MECNKDEALRAVEIAERKFLERDFTGAKRFVLKAQKLYPKLDGLPQMLATFDVHIHSEKKVCGEADWYRILGANPGDNEETIRKQYRKLVLMLHPDKNKSIGADGAFNLVSEAWNLLSVRLRRHAHDQKRNTVVPPPTQPSRAHPTTPSSGNGSQLSKSEKSKEKPKTRPVKVAASTDPAPHKTQPSYAHPTTPSSGNGIRLSESEKSKEKPKTRPMKVAASTDDPPHKDGTFWTICSTCRTHYEYQRRYLNHNLLCPNCSEVFIAVEKEPPKHIFNSLKASYVQVAAPDSSTVQGAAPDSSTVQGAAPDSSTVQGAAPDASTVHQGAAPDASTFQGACELYQVCREKRDCLKRWRMSFASEEEKPKRKKVGNYHGPRGSGGDTNGKGRAVLSSAKRAPVFYRINNLLVKKAHAVVPKKLEELTSDAMVVEKVVQLKGQEASSVLLTKNNKPMRASDAGAAENAALSMDVPDPGFHNFDLDRSEGSFNVDQVWAAYDDADDMPRFYARIHKVISLDPFKVKLSWLDSLNNDEFGYMSWIESGFYKTCGDFKAGKQQICDNLNGFSHEIVWLESAPGVGTIRILPRKGETWALFQNWSLEWNDATPDDVVFKYDIMEVLDDYNEERGILVSPLVKVTGFRSVFCPCEEQGKAISIPKDEIQRFSHQIPSHLLTGEEASDLCAAFRELDPAALPKELLDIVERKKPDAEDNNWAEVDLEAGAEQGNRTGEVAQEASVEQGESAGVLAEGTDGELYNMVNEVGEETDAEQDNMVDEVAEEADAEQDNRADEVAQEAGAGQDNRVDEMTRKPVQCRITGGDGVAQEAVARVASHPLHCF